MKCPACNSELAKYNVGKLQLDVCTVGCAGIWFDHNELHQIDDVDEYSDPNLEQLTPAIDLQLNEQKLCPICVNEPLVKQFLGVQKKVEVDLCWKCSGVWLDHGELVRVRTQHKSAAARVEESEQATSAVVENLAEVLKKEAALANPVEAQRKSRMVKFIGKFLGIKELMRD